MIFRMQGMLLSEWRGRFYGASRRFWYLSDGGYFEVTGAYELLRRRLPFVIVTDTGQGIPKERLARLFSPFERLGAEQSTVEGTGLGLALSKRLVDAMGGTLGMESVVGQGSTFWVELALVEAPTERQERLESGLPPDLQQAGARVHTRSAGVRFHVRLGLVGGPFRAVLFVALAQEPRQFRGQ